MDAQSPCWAEREQKAPDTRAGGVTQVFRRKIIEKPGILLLMARKTTQKTDFLGKS
jgi:hypothetical protein